CGRLVTRTRSLPPLDPCKDANDCHEQCSEDRHGTYAPLEPQLLHPLFGQLSFHLGSLVGCLGLMLKPRALDLQSFLTRLPQLLYLLVFVRCCFLVSGVTSCPSSRVFRPPGFVCLGRCRTQRGALVIAENACLYSERSPALAVLKLSPYPTDRLIPDRVARWV